MSESDGLTQEFAMPIKSTIDRIRNMVPAENIEEDRVYCGKCEYGFIIVKGRARPCSCRSRRGIGTRQESIETLLKRNRAGISQKLARVSAHTFLTARPGYEHHDHVKITLDQYIRDLEAGKKYGWYIFGKTGVGKSYAAAYVINTVKHKRIMIAAMVNFSRILSALRQTFKDQTEHQELMDVLFDTPLLAIDDLGMEQRVNENPELSWSVSKFYEVIDYRRDNELPTIITSNRTPEELKDRLGEAIMERIKNLTLRLDM